MNRELKFRIWNGSKMEYDVTVGRFGTFYVNPEKGDGLNPEDNASLTVNTTKYHEVTPVMQYTGLKDRNGKEIYEGDILKGAYVNGYNAKVIFDRGCFCIYSIRTDIISYDTFKQEAYSISISEIIGNIYENPELL